VRSVPVSDGYGVMMRGYVNALRHRIINLIRMPTNIIRTARLFLMVIREGRHPEDAAEVIGLRKALGLLTRNAGLLWRVASTTHEPAQQAEDSRNGRVCFVLGNGPSLDADIDEKSGFLGMGDTLCVNDFAKTDLYIKIQPKYYVFADPCWWVPTSPENIVSRRNHVYGEMLRKTSWPLTIYVPFAARSYFEPIFSRSHNIHLSFYNITSLDVEGILEYILYDLGLAMPKCQNVLVGALFLSLRLGYRKIILLGADHSWHETLALDDAGRVCMKNEHFYDKDSKLTPWTKDGTEENIWTMGELFHALAKMFEGYWQIEGYARYLGAEICNASSVTFIDAFRRKHIAELLGELAVDVQKK